MSKQPTSTYSNLANDVKNDIFANGIDIVCYNHVAYYLRAVTIRKLATYLLFVINKSIMCMLKYSNFTCRKVQDYESTIYTDTNSLG